MRAPSSKLGLSIELWWHDRLVQKWETLENDVRLPSNLLALEGYEAQTPFARREGGSYRVLVPDGCSASEPLAGRQARVSTERPLEIGKSGLRLRVLLTPVKKITWVFKLSAVLAALTLTLIFTAAFNIVIFQESPPTSIDAPTSPPTKALPQARIKFFTSGE